MAEVAGSIPVGPTNTSPPKLIHQDFLFRSTMMISGSRLRLEIFRSVGHGA